MAAKPTATRRAPDPATRQRDADRSRDALLDAALKEFAANGYAGAGTTDIAARAGVNKQLISYYFGGKEGLYQALVERWLRVEAEIAQPGTPLADVVIGYLDLIKTQPELFRLFLWEELAYPAGGGSDAHAAGGAEPGDPAAAPEVADIVRRQREGEITAELDPAFVLLVLMAVTMMPVALARQVKLFTGLEPDSPELAERLREQVRLLVRQLAPPVPAAGRRRPGATRQDRPTT